MPRTMPSSDGAATRESSPGLNRAAPDGVVEDVAYQSRQIVALSAILALLRWRQRLGIAQQGEELAAGPEEFERVTNDRGDLSAHGARHQPLQLASTRRPERAVAIVTSNLPQRGSRRGSMTSARPNAGRGPHAGVCCRWRERSAAMLRGRRRGRSRSPSSATRAASSSAALLERPGRVQGVLHRRRRRLHAQGAPRDARRSPTPPSPRSNRSPKKARSIRCAHAASRTLRSHLEHRRDLAQAAPPAIATATPPATAASQSQVRSCARSPSKPAAQIASPTCARSAAALNLLIQSMSSRS